MAHQSNPAGSEDIFHEIPEFLNSETGAAAHAFFGRAGGVSTGLYSGLNCGVGSDDDPAHVTRNRGIIAEQMGTTPDHFITLHQVHSDTCIRVEKAWGTNERPKADAFVTDVPGLALGVLTADCAPALFYGEADGRPVVGAAHAGWGGAFKGVLEATVKGLEEVGANKDTIRACIGPCIQKRSYEVGPEFFEQFVKEDDENERFFMNAVKDGHFMFDLPGYCAFRLYRAGLAQVSISDIDTYSNEAGFYSYRRSTHRNEPDYGRQASVIMIKP